MYAENIVIASMLQSIFDELEDIQQLHGTHNDRRHSSHNLHDHLNYFYLSPL